MELDKYRKKTVATRDETREIINGIPSMRDMFLPFPDYKGDLFGDYDNTNGILYLSRLNADEFRPPKKDDSGIDEGSAAAATVHTEEMKTTGVVTMTTSTRNKKRRFALSLSTLAMKPIKRTVIVEEGAVSSLIELSQLDDIPIKRCCASAFCSLASEPSIRPKMIEQGAFQAIIALSAASSKSVKAACCKTLCNLCCEPGYEYRAVKEGAPYAVVQIAGICPENIMTCLITLLNISCVKDKFGRIEEVTDALLHFYSLKLREDERVVVLSALCNLSSLRNNQLRLVEDGILRVVERASKMQSISLRTIASQILRNLTTDSRTRGKLMDQFVLTTLIGMARDDIEVVKTSCVHAFYNLSRDNACREKIVSGNAVGVIIRMSMEKMDNVDMGRTASKTLRILCGDKVLAHKLVGDGIVKALMSLIRTDDGTIRQYCAESICSLFQNESVLSRLIDQGAVNVLVSLSQSNHDIITGEWCAFALFQLCTNDLCPTYLLANGILPCLIRLCASPSVRTKKFCGAALWSITVKKKTVDVSTAIPVLVDMLRNESSVSIKVDCASALYNLADSDSNCDQMLSVGALIPVVKLTQADSLQVKIKCAAILSRLSCHDKYYREFASEDVLNVLLELSCLEHALTQRRVVIAVSNLSQFPELRKMLLKLKGTEYIISLASKPDEHIRRGCAAIICNMSYEEGSEAAMLKDGVVSTLLITALVTSDQLPTKLICAKALVNLMYDPESYTRMVEESVIWGLGNLTLLDNTDILNMCAKALCNLSCKFARVMLSSKSTINAIMKLIKQQGNIDLQRYSGRILTNILMQTNDADEEFRGKAVENMLVMAACKDKEVSEMCIFCLCLASQSESCRANIVTSGILHLIDVSSIFHDSSVSYAYLTLFGNIANNPMMRTQVMDDQCVSRFMSICDTHDPSLDNAVIKALYCLSCATENITKLVDQNSLSIVETVWRADYEKSEELIEHIIALMFNLTTLESTQGKLVSQGLVHVFYELWDHVKSNYSMLILSITAMCHLACGNVNTSQMVREGCVEILCFATQHKKDDRYASYVFSHEIVERCSAAFRNLSISIPNQEKMVSLGTIECIVDLISLNGESLDDKDFAATRKNCASALRSMTYNIAIRQQLVASGAILIILQDLTRNFEGDELNMDIDLLCELEAESWCNGSRGQQKESRAGRIPEAHLFTDLLKGTSNVVLNVDRVSVDQSKFLVKVHLQEPPIETEGALEALEHGFQDLASFVDDDSIAPSSTMTYNKRECKLNEQAALAGIRKASLSSINQHGSTVKDEEDEEDDDNTSVPTHLDLVATARSKPDTAPSRYDVNQDVMLQTESSLGNSANTTISFVDQIKPQSAPAAQRPTNAESGRLPSLAKKMIMRGVAIADKDVVAEESDCSPIAEQFQTDSFPSLRKKAPLRKSGVKEFKGLVALINHSSKAKNVSSGNSGNIDGVLRRWSTLSKY